MNDTLLVAIRHLDGDVIIMTDVIQFWIPQILVVGGMVLSIMGFRDGQK